MNRSALVAGLTLPRYYHDLPAATLAAFWIVVLLVGGYAFLAYAGGARIGRWYWLAAAAFLAPWALPALSPRWL